jgi:hypothetical protein
LRGLAALTRERFLPSKSGEGLTFCWVWEGHVMIQERTNIVGNATRAFGVAQPSTRLAATPQAR